MQLRSSSAAAAHYGAIMSAQLHRYVIVGRGRGKGRGQARGGRDGY